jgi:hypothetical protein
MNEGTPSGLEHNKPWAAVLKCPNAELYFLPFLRIHYQNYLGFILLYILFLILSNIVTANKGPSVPYYILLVRFLYGHAEGWPKYRQKHVIYNNYYYYYYYCSLQLSCHSVAGVLY